MDAIVMAGGKTGPKDPLYPLAKLGYKSMLDVCGRPMVQWVLDALVESGQVNQIVVVGLPIEIHLDCSRPLHRLDDRGDLIGNIQAGAQYLMKVNPQEAHALAVSSDVPGITPEIVRWLVERVRESDHDFYFTVIERSVMEKRYPDSKRTYLKLKDYQLCGGDANALNKATAVSGNPIYQRLHEARKNPVKQAGMVGFDLLALLMLGRLTLQEAERRASKRMGIRGRAILCPYAEIGMDVDKPFQYDILMKDLEAQRRV